MFARQFPQALTILAVFALLLSATSWSFADPGGNPGVNNPGVSQESPSNGDGKGNPGNNNPGQNNTNNPGSEGSTGNPGKNNPGTSQESPSGGGGKGNPGNNDPRQNNTNNPGNEGSSGNASASAANGGNGDGASPANAAKSGGDNGKPASDDKGKPEGAGAGKQDAAKGGSEGSGGKPAPDQSGKSSGPADHSPKGNNGTIKVHDGSRSAHDVELRRNEPHVGCVFHLYGFHFDAEQAGTYSFYEWAPTGTKGDFSAGGGWKATAQGDWQSNDWTLSDGHYRLEFYTFDGHSKNKMFWVEGCAETPPPGGDDDDDDNDCPNGMPRNEAGNCGNGGGNGDNDNDNDCPNGMPRNEAGNCGNGGGDQGGPDKVWVCHRTGSESNPYVIIHISRQGWENGHSGHEGDEMAEDRDDLDIEACLDDEDTTPPGGGNTPPGDTTTTPPGDTTVVLGSDVICVNNVFMTRTFVNGSVTGMASTGVSCVLGVQTPPATGSVIVIVERVIQEVAQLGEQAAPIVATIAQLPSTATKVAGENAGLGVAGMAIVAAGLLLLRRRSATHF